jgi:hypothetical protein
MSAANEDGEESSGDLRVLHVSKIYHRMDSNHLAMHAIIAATTFQDG